MHLCNEGSKSEAPPISLLLRIYRTLGKQQLCSSLPCLTIFFLFPFFHSSLKSSLLSLLFLSFSLIGNVSLSLYMLSVRNILCLFLFPVMSIGVSGFSSFPPSSLFSWCLPCSLARDTHKHKERNQLKPSRPMVIFPSLYLLCVLFESLLVFFHFSLFNSAASFVCLMFSFFSIPISSSI